MRNLLERFRAAAKARISRWVAPLAPVWDRLAPLRDFFARHGGTLGAVMPVVLFAGLVVMKAWIVRGMGLENWNPLSAVLLEGGFALLVFALIAWGAPRGIRLWVLFFADLFISLMLAGTQIYVRQFEMVPTAEAVVFAGQLGAVPQSVYALFRPRYWIFFMDLIFILPVLVLWPGLRKMGPRRYDKRVRHLLFAGAIWSTITIVMLASVGPIADGMQGSRKRGLFAYQAVYSLLVPYNALTQPEKPVKTDHTADVQKLQKKVSDLGGNPGGVRIANAPKRGIAKGKNVIIIQCEALQTTMVGARINGVEVTPNINRLITQSWYAPHMYTQVGKGNTSDAEFIANTSAMGRKGKAASVAWGDKVVPSLPRLLGEQGYTSNTFHANDVTFWNRDQMYPALGFDKYWDAAYFGDEDIIGLGPSDAVLFKMSLPVLRDMDSRGQLFYAQIVTLTSHHPYYRAAELVDFPLPEDLQGTTAGEYICAINYLDAQLGVFIQELQNAGMWDDTLFVMYGDHFGIKQRDLSASQQDLLASLVGHPYSPADHFQIPFVVHIPGQSSSGLVDSVVAQMDILPTVADLMGIDLSNTVHFGTTVFEGGSKIVPIRYYTPEGTFVTDDFFFRPGIGYEDGETWDIRTGLKTDVPPSEELYEQAVEFTKLCADYLDGLPVRKGADKQ